MQKMKKIYTYNNIYLYLYSSSTYKKNTISNTTSIPYTNMLGCCPSHSEKIQVNRDASTKCIQ